MSRRARPSESRRAVGEKGEKRSRRGPLAPHPGIWDALGEGRILLEVLQDFYTRVFADQRLAPFFHGVTKQRVIEKQYSFLYSKLTGRDVYFGDRPRNAHHWMVISNELFDYREELLVRCLRDHGLPDDVVGHIRAIDEGFRKQIVKCAPRPRKLGGVELPLEGYGFLKIEVGSVCDGCEEPMEPGDGAVYHLRTGVAYCQSCSSRKRLVPVESSCA